MVAENNVVCEIHTSSVMHSLEMQFLLQKGSQQEQQSAGPVK